MICRDCQKDFIPNLHWRRKWGLCKPCQKTNSRRIKNKYKTGEKGKLTNERWIKSEKRKELERKLRAKPRAKQMAVLRTIRYCKKYPEKKREKDKLYSYRRRGYNAGYMDWEAVNKLSKICGMCSSVSDLTIDHIKPLSLGGTNELNNLQILCRSCNASKGARYAT